MTWRYSAKHEEVKKARNLVSEAWLVEKLNRMTEEVRFSVGKHATVKGRKTRENKSFAKSAGKGSAVRNRETNRWSKARESEELMVIGELKACRKRQRLWVTNNGLERRENE